MLKTILFSITVLITAGIGLLVYSCQKLEKIRAQDQAHMTKPDEERLGEQFAVPRKGKDPVGVNLYIPENADNLPVVFNIHGGAFIAGDADTLDTQSNRISKSWNVIVVTINYRLMTDAIPIAYSTEEVIDVIRYFKENARTYRADPEHFCVMGYSAGAYHAAAAALALKAEDIDMAAQVLCYAYIGDVVKHYNTLSPEQKTTMAPALFVLADNDSFSNESLAYQKALEANGVSAEVKKYAGSIHGFLEENNPEYEKIIITISKSPQQERIARKAEDFIGTWLNRPLGRCPEHPSRSARKQQRESARSPKLPLLSN